jgi:hypothetical protein
MAQNNRRPFLRTLFLFLLLLFWPGDSFSASIGDPIGERFRGEVLKYNIGFWIFTRVGEGEATFQSLGNGRYLAYHEGKTLGLVGWISRYRRDFYRSTMGTINNGKRLIPLRFEEEVVIGKKIRKRITTYDYNARRVFVETQKEEKVTREEIEIPFGVIYDDPMTAFYNFRSGVYGKVEPGKKFSIYTVPRGGSQKVIRMVVASKEEAGKKRSEEVEKERKDLFITVTLDKELVGSLQGLVETWFSADIVPVSGVAKDVFFWGDITGKLTYQGFLESSGKFYPLGKGIEKEFPDRPQKKHAKS